MTGGPPPRSGLDVILEALAADTPVGVRERPDGRVTFYVDRDTVRHAGEATGQ